MSIAVSAVVRPSACLRLLLAGLAAGAAACAVPLLADPGAFRLAVPGAGASAAAAVLALRALRGNVNPRRVDISGVGQIRVTVYQGIGLAGPAETVRLLAGSTLWPGLLLLRLGGADGRVAALPIGPGSVAGPAFRPLAVACRALAARAGGWE